MNAKNVLMIVNMFLALCLCSCSIFEPTNQPLSTSTSTPGITHEFDGYWISDNSNKILDIHDNQAAMYQLTQMSCVGPILPTTLLQQGSNTYWQNWRFTLTGDTLDAYYIDAPGFISWTKTPELPELCKDQKMLQTKNPVVNFEVLWHTFEENYAFFELRKVDWQIQYDQYQPKVREDMSQNDLFSLMSDLLQPINDAHVFIATSSKFFSPAKSNPNWSNNDLMQSLIISKYFDHKTTLAGNDQIVYGTLNDTIGYINILGEAGYASAGIDEATAAAKAIDQAIQDLNDVKAIIVDVRFNGGGFDDVSLTLASRFADQRRLVFSYVRKNGDSFTTPYERYLEPAGNVQFTKPVFLLTSDFTISSGETFVLAMHSLPNVKIIGERTRGCITSENYMLPNGWWLGVPDMKVIASDGKNYDVIGIPPDIEMAMKSYDPNGKDEILEKAIELASVVK